MQKSILNEMTQFLESLVVRSWFFEILARWNHDLRALLFNLRHDRVGVVAFVSQQMLHLEPVDQPFRFRAICSGTFRNNNSERHTMRIHGQVYLGVEPPLVRLMP